MSADLAPGASEKFSAEEGREDFYVPEDFAPSDGECAVLSAVALLDGDDWVLASGSLLTVGRDVALGSWRRWQARQPSASPGSEPHGFDLGPVFVVDPFPGVRLARQVIATADWRATVEAIGAGEYRCATLRLVVRADHWSSKVLLGCRGSSDAHNAVDGVCRPVVGIVGAIDAPDPREVKHNWQLALPPHVPRGRELGEMYRNRSMTGWPALVGIGWLAPEVSPPPARFVIGRPSNEAWMAQVRPDYDAGELSIDLAWDEKAIDPLGCSLLVRSEHDQLPVLTRQVRISDLPSRAEELSEEPRSRPWSERLLTVTLPRGPRRTSWGAMLLAPDGRLLDELPVVERVERMEMSLYVNDSPGPASVSIIGDRDEPPDSAQRDEAVAQALALEAAAREAAAQRRISTAGQLMRYLRWRLSCVAGELLIIDHSLLRGNEAKGLVLPFLEELGRPIRALTKSIDPSVASEVTAGSPIQARLLPHGTKTVHDRVWLVGNTGLLVGGSANTFIPSPQSGTSPATTVAELPYGDAAEWRRRFEEWWGPPSRTT